jgi:putative ABC transport system ATP-binding protein
VISVTNLTKTFKSGGGGIVTAVDDVSFSLEDGRFASIVGTSGSGKSTLLSLLGGLERPTAGEVRVNDQAVTSQSDRQLIEYRRHTVGFVFQNFSLIPNLSAKENVMLPMEFAGMRKAERSARASALLDQVGLSGDKQLRRPSRLSGGEQQRVAIARALANRPSIILADEPTGNLDSKTGTTIVDLLGDLSKSEGTTVIVVTHDTSITSKTDAQFRSDDGELTSVTPATHDSAPM